MTTQTHDRQPILLSAPVTRATWLERAWCRKEDARIAAHLRGAHREVSAHDVSHLDPATKRRRTRALDGLAAFTDAGVFPRNRHFSSPTPYIRDTENPRDVCAVAHMMLTSGDAPLVDMLASTDNNVWLRDAQDPGVDEWLQRNGFTREEAARIQVPYMSQPTFLQMYSWYFALGAAVVVFLGIQWMAFSTKRRPKLTRKYVMAIAATSLVMAFTALTATFFVSGLVDSYFFPLGRTLPSNPVTLSVADLEQ